MTRRSYKLLFFPELTVVLFSDEQSALLLALNEKTDDHLEMLNCGIIYRLLNEKWETFARVRIKLVETGSERSSSVTPWYRHVHVRTY